MMDLRMVTMGLRLVSKNLDLPKCEREKTVKI